MALSCLVQSHVSRAQSLPAATRPHPPPPPPAAAIRIIPPAAAALNAPRRYLGVQSPTDVMAGALVGGLFLAIGYMLGGAFDAALTLPYSMTPFFQPLVWWLLLLAYPSPIAPSRNFTETAAVAGCAAGWALGGASCFACLVHPVQPCLTPDCFWLVVLRSVLGISTMIATQVWSGRLAGAKQQLNEA